MARSTMSHTVSLPTAEDLSALTMGRFVRWVQGAAGVTRCGAHLKADGVHVTSPSAINGNVVGVQIGAGKAMVESGGIIAAGQEVASDAQGRAVAATVYAGEVTLGKALEAVGAAGREFTLLYYGCGGGPLD